MAQKGVGAGPAVVRPCFFSCVRVGIVAFGVSMRGLKAKIIGKNMRFLKNKLKIFWR